MSIRVNGRSRVPPGFRFHPTEEELLSYYLRKKMACEKVDLDVIRDVDLNKLEPWDIQEKCRIGSTPQNDWYFFSHKDKKYPTGTRTNRATAAGFWKATGRDKVIYANLKRLGMRKTLVFYRGRAPQGQKSDWIMHEYRLDERQETNLQSSACSSLGEFVGQEDGWVVCRVFKKKNYHKELDGPHNSSSITSNDKTQMLHSAGDRALDQILQYMGRLCKQENDHPRTSTANVVDNSSSRTGTETIMNNNNHMKYLLPIDVAAAGNGFLDKFMKLPSLESSSFLNDCPPQLDQSCCSETGNTIPTSDNMLVTVSMEDNTDSYNQTDPGVHEWAAVLEHFVASPLNCQADASKQLSFFEDTDYGAFSSSTRLISTPQDCNHSGGDDMDLWAFSGSASSSGSDHLYRTSD